MTDRDTRKAPLKYHLPAKAGALTILVTAAVTWLWAHEGHPPLPSRGAQIDIAKGLISLSREARDALDVEVTEVVERSLPETVSAYAKLVTPWQHHAFASSRLPGRITKMHVVPGQTVEIGQVLAEVASVELEALQLELVNIQNDIRLSNKVVQSLKESLESIAGQQLLDAQAKVQQEQNSLEVAQAKWLSLELAQDALDGLLKHGKRLPSLQIRSPIRGTVIHADLTVGRVVEGGEHLFEVVDLSKVWAKIGVLEKDLARVLVGYEVEIRLTAYPEEIFRGKVQVSGFYLDPQTHVNTVWAEFANPTGQEPRLLPGMSGQARIFLPGTANSKMVPTDAVIYDGLERYVLVEETGAAGVSEYRKKNIVVTRQSPKWLEFQSNEVFPGDRVVLRGSHELGGFFVPGVLRFSPEAARTINLRVETVSSHAVEDVTELDGFVDVPPKQRTFASAQIAGTLRRIHIDRSQSVRVGDVIAEVVSTELQSVQLDLLKERLVSQLVEQQLKSFSAAEGSFPRRKLWELESNLNASRNRQESLRQRLAVLGLSSMQLDELLRNKKLVDALPIRAPISGIVVNFDKVLGQALRADEPLAEIHDLSRPWVQALVSEGDLARVQVGQNARIRFVGDSGLVFTGKVVRSGRVFGSEDRTLSVWVEMDHFSEQPLRHNQLARLSLTMRQSAPTLAVPLAAVVREGTQGFVFVQEQDGTFDRRDVETGKADDRYVEITRGLQPGEVIVVQGTADLQTAYASLR